MISELGDLWITCSILAVSAYIIHYFKNYGKLPVLFCKPGSKFDSFIRKRVPSSKTRYMPLYWFAESRCQTILRYFLPCFARITCRREVVRPSNGGQFYLEWYDNVTSNSFLDCETRPTIIILPGITSTSDSSYIKSMVGRLLNRGYRVIILVYRGLQNMEVLSPLMYSATYTKDLEHTVETFRTRHPKARLFAVGASMGSLILAAYLEDKGGNSGIDAAMFFSCPFNPPICTKEIETWANRWLINVQVTNSLKQIYRRNSDVFKTFVNHDKVMGARIIREFDDHFTAPMFGYKSVDEYYQDSVLNGEKLSAIAIPVLCVNANDDMFSPERALPKTEIVNSDNVALLMTHGGGHVTHLQGFNPFGKNYFEQVMEEFFDAIVYYGEELLKK